MNFTKLDALLSICFSKENKRKLTKEEQALYVKEIKQLLTENQFEDGLLHYILVAPQYLGLRGYMGWYYSASYEQQIDSMEKILNSKIMKNFPNQRRFRSVLFLLSAAVSGKELNNGVINQLLAWVDELSYNKDGSRTNDLGKAFKTCFFDTLKLNVELPNLKYFGYSEDYEGKLVRFFEEALESIELTGPEEIKKANAIKKWIKTIKTENSKIVVNTTNKDNSSKEIEKDISVNISTENAANEMGESASKENAGTNNISGKTATKLLEFVYAVDAIEKAAMEIEKDAKTKEKKISLLNVRLKDSTNAVHELEKENTELRERLVVQQNQMDILTTENTELKARVERQVSVLDVFQEDKENAQSEQLNALASSLVRLYKEFETAQTMDLSTELEMTLLDLIEDIFRKLEKNGVDVKGRL